MTRFLQAMRLAATLVGLLAVPALASAQRPLVYCPVGIDETGCAAVVNALGEADRAYDGSMGTVDLRTADLGAYSVFVVPSLADDGATQPYALLRDVAVADRLRGLLLGRQVFWSGTPDLGTASRGDKDALIRRLAGWAAGNHSVVNAPGLLVLQDRSATTSQRYAWVEGLTGQRIVADPALNSYSSVRSLTAIGVEIVGGAAYSNMASLGFYLPSGASDISMDAVGNTGTSIGGQVVLMTAPGANTGGAKVWTDKDDYEPGETVIMQGSGWQPGETVVLTLTEDPEVHQERSFSVIADSSGNFRYDGFAPEEHDVGVRFVLTAVGQSSARHAQTTFTDGRYFSYTLSPSTAALNSTLTYTVTVTNLSRLTALTSVQVNRPSGYVNFVCTNPPQPSAANGWTRTSCTTSVITWTHSTGLTHLQSVAIPVVATTQNSTTETEWDVTASPSFVRDGNRPRVAISDRRADAILTPTLVTTSTQDLYQLTVTNRSSTTLRRVEVERHGDWQDFTSGNNPGFVCPAVADGTLSSGWTANCSSSSTVITLTSSTGLGDGASVVAQFKATTKTSTGIRAWPVRAFDATSGGNPFALVDPEVEIGAGRATAAFYSGSTLNNPASMITGETSTHTLRVTRTAGSTALGSALIEVPSGFTNLSFSSTGVVDSIRVAASQSADAFWDVIYDASNNRVILRATANGNRLGSNRFVQFDVTVTAPTTAGTYTWETRAWQDFQSFAEAEFYLTTEPQVTVTAPACTAPSFTASPSAQTITYGDDATFSAAVSGTAPVGIQWAVETATGSGTYADLDGETNLTLTVTKPLVSQSGRRYRATISNSCGTASATALLTVNPRAASVAPADKSKVYGAADPLLTGNVVGFLAEDNVTATYNRVAGETVLGGPYEISATLSPSDVLSNYDITYHTGDFTIEPTPVTATAGSGSGTYNGSPQSPAACSVTGAYTGDLSCANDPASVGPNVGTFTIMPVVSGTGLSNFDISKVNGSYTIDPAEVTATAGSGSGSSNGSPHSPPACAVTGSYTGDLSCANDPASVGPALGTYTITPVVSGTGLTNFDITSVNGSYSIIDAQAPIVTNTQALPVAVNVAGRLVTATISDATTGGSKITSWYYTIDGVPSATMNIPAANQAVTYSASAALPAFTTTDVKEICVYGTDAAGNLSVKQNCALLAVYDPSAGFVTGGGWIQSQQSFCRNDNPLCANADGKANFGFVSKYLKGATVPTGNTEFQLQAGNFNFKSNVYEWLVVNQSATNAQFKGTGTINGSGSYKFMIRANDMSPDGFDIRIWDESTGVEVEVYATGGYIALNNVTGNGSIQIHAPKK